MTVEEMFKKHKSRVRAEWEEFMLIGFLSSRARAATGGNAEFKGAPAEAVEPKPAENDTA